MLVTERHIQYLEWVEQGRVALKDSYYVSAIDDDVDVNPLIAVHTALMSLTHIVYENNRTMVALTHRGFAILNDEREAWG